MVQIRVCGMVCRLSPSKDWLAEWMLLPLALHDLQLITDPGSTVNVRLQSTQTETLLKGSITGDLTMEMIPQEVKLKAGDLVLTSGLGGGYPSDVLVGQVVSIQSREGELFQSASIQPAVDFSHLRAVLVISNFKPVDIEPLTPTLGLHRYMPVLIGIPVLIFTVVLQTTAFSRLPLLYGTADIVLLVILAWILNERVKHGWEWVVHGGTNGSVLSLLFRYSYPLWIFSCCWLVILA